MLRLAIVLSLLAGCTVSDGGAIDMKWHVTDGGAEVACDVVAAATVKVTVVRAAGGSPISAPFSCNSKAGKIEGLRTGEWTVTLELLNAGGQSLGPPASFTVKVARGKTVELPQEVEFAFAASSYVTFSWVTTVNGTPEVCGGEKVILTSTPVDGGEPYSDSFVCTERMGKTAPLPAGTYTFTVSVVDGQTGRELLSPGTTAPMVLHKGETKALGTFELAYFYRVATFTPAFGAACSSFEVRVSDPAASKCLEYPVTVIPSTEGPGWTCKNYLCDPDMGELRMAGLGDGSYLIQVFACDSVGCYCSDAKPFTVAGADLALGTIQVPFDAAHLCNGAKPAE